MIDELVFPLKQNPDPNAKVTITVLKKREQKPGGIVFNVDYSKLKFEEPEVCPICGEGHVTLFSQPAPMNHKGISGTVEMHFKVCDHCHSEYAGAEEMDFNCKAAREFRASCE